MVIIQNGINLLLMKVMTDGLKVDLWGKIRRLAISCADNMAAAEIPSVRHSCSPARLSMVLI